MRTSADERLLPPCPARPWSSTSTRPAFRFARWKAIEAPITPEPMTRKSAVRSRACMEAPPGSPAPPEVGERLVGGVVAGRPGHAAPRMRAGAAEVEPAHGAAVARPAGHRPHEEELL